MLNKVRSNYIQKAIFGSINNRRKLRIVKYNKRICIKLNNTKKDFEIYESLKKFNEEFNLSIIELDIKE